MVPSCRTPEEGDRVLAEMARSGLVRGENALEVSVMCELPSNVIASMASRSVPTTSANSPWGWIAIQP